MQSRVVKKARSSGSPRFRIHLPIDVRTIGLPLAYLSGGAPRQTGDQTPFRYLPAAVGQPLEDLQRTISAPDSSHLKRRHGTLFEKRLSIIDRWVCQRFAKHPSPARLRALHIPSQPAHQRSKASAHHTTTPHRENGSTTILANGSLPQTGTSILLHPLLYLVLVLVRTTSLIFLKPSEPTDAISQPGASTNKPVCKSANLPKTAGATHTRPNTDDGTVPARFQPSGRGGEAGTDGGNSAGYGGCWIIVRGVGDVVQFLNCGERAVFQEGKAFAGVSEAYWEKSSRS